MVLFCDVSFLTLLLIVFILKNWLLEREYGLSGLGILYRYSRKKDFMLPREKPHIVYFLYACNKTTSLKK